MNSGQPKTFCDIVMKGGITSGVVYPSAVCELAKTYLFKNVGGTSAGAIAAASTAAAEYGRTTGSGGFPILEELPVWLSTGANLSNLFQPGQSTKRLYALVLSFLGSENPYLKASRAIITAIVQYWSATVVALLVDGWIWHYLGRNEKLNIAQMISNLVVLMLILSVSIAWAIWQDVKNGLTDNGFGLCNGMDREDGKPKPLTDWLTNELNRIAGLDVNEAPLTFGDLWDPPTADQGRNLQQIPIRPYEDLPDILQDDPVELGHPSPAINLRMLTSCVTLGQPFALPFTDRTFFFDPKTLSKYFPRNVVEWMCANAAQPRTKREALEHEILMPLRPIPLAKYFPIVVATRLSLSFPVLLSAVPLYAIDWGRKSNQKAGTEITNFVSCHGDNGLSDLRGMSKSVRNLVGLGVTAEPCWFSDGGISCNFPIEFFDAPLPRWPTFAIDLDSFSIDTGDESPVESNNVWMPDSNYGGRLPVWNRFGDGDRRERLLGFVTAIFDTMQNWVDNAQTRIPGYRDRVAHVLLSANEGGLNLTMPRNVVKKLIVRGSEAGKLIIGHFANPSSCVETTWMNHRWVRFRSFIGMFSPIARDFDNAIDSGSPSYRSFTGCAFSPPSYGWKSSGQGNAAAQVVAALTQAGTIATPAGQPLDAGAPNPSPELVARPKL